MITFENFFKNTSAIFKGCKIPKRKPDYISYKKSWYDEYNEETGEWESVPSSYYYYGKDKKGSFVIRVSDHWSTYKRFDFFPEEVGCGSVASCYWKIKTNSDDYEVAGKCYLENFKIIN